MEITTYEHQKLKRLQFWLNYEISGTGLFFISWIAFGKITFYFIYLIVAVFSVYMLYVLFIEKKFGWIISFFVFVLLPGVLLKIFLNHSEIYKYFALLPFGLFFFYCFLLRLTINDWLH